MSVDLRVPALRVTPLNQHPVRAGAHVLYWMIAARRTRSNFGLQRALWHATQLGRPLVVLEPLRSGHRWASARSHAFVLQGMRDNQAAFDAAGVAYHPYVEREVGDGSGLLAALARDAAVVVTDEFPCFFYPRMLAAAGARLDVRVEVVDGNGLLPLRATPRAFPTAYGFRRHLQRSLAPHLQQFPVDDPLARVGVAAGARVHGEIARRWPAASAAMLQGDASSLPVDQSVGPAPVTGGARAAQVKLERFFEDRLHRYRDDRSHPDRDAASGLSAWLHFGHIGVHDIVGQLMEQQDWSPDRLGDQVTGWRHGWWGMSEAAESFLDELVTWRELSFAFCHHRPTDYDRYSGLPKWARKTLAEHAEDEREHVYSVDAFAAAQTHDPVWNAAQNQLRSEGRIHNALRMLWGKKVLEWTASPQEAAEVLIELNNRYALDGRDPNSYSGIFWTLGRFDRAWGPERPIFGKVRYMSSASARRKWRMREYLKTWST